MIRSAPVTLLLAILVFCPAAAQAQSRNTREGRALAEQHCAACHAIGKRGRSQREGAPPFRTLGRTYDLDSLQEALAEGIAVGHKGVDMPEFQFSPDRIDALIAYLRSLRR